jgi:replication-associated recombination protein RarA
MPKRRTRLSNQPPLTVELERKDVEFIVTNCNANIRMGINSLEAFRDSSRDVQEKFVNLIEQFKRLKAVMEDAMAKDDELRVITEED